MSNLSLAGGTACSYGFETWSLHSLLSSRTIVQHELRYKTQARGSFVSIESTATAYGGTEDRKDDAKSPRLSHPTLIMPDPSSNTTSTFGEESAPRSRESAAHSQATRTLHDQRANLSAPDTNDTSVRSAEATATDTGTSGGPVQRTPGYGDYSRDTSTALKKHYFPYTVPHVVHLMPPLQRMSGPPPGAQTEFGGPSANSVPNAVHSTTFGAYLAAATEDRSPTARSRPLGGFQYPEAPGSPTSHARRDEIAQEAGRSSRAILLEDSNDGRSDTRSSSQ